MTGVQRVIVAFVVFVGVASVCAREVLELHAVNFELALTNYKYAAILFYDDSEAGQILDREWTEGCSMLDGLSPDAEVAKIDGRDPELKELIDAYSIQIPSIKVFRRGIMADYRGPYDSKGIEKYIEEDSLPSVQIVGSLPDAMATLKRSSKTVVLGFFSAEEMVEDDSAEGYSINAWGQFQAAADSLRGYVGMAHRPLSWWMHIIQCVHVCTNESV
jgi:hypothetical protein